MNDIVNTPNIHPSRTPSSNHNDHTANLFDRINARLKSIKDQEQKDKTFKKDHFFGYVLYSVPITVAEFSEMFPPETSFHKEVIFGTVRTLQSKQSTHHKQVLK